MSRIPSRPILLLAIILALTLGVAAQTQGEITGVIMDSGGAAVSGAVVSVTNRGTNATRQTTTNSEGVYSFPALQPGLYSLKVEQAGFKTALRDGLTLEVQQTARIDLTLEVGAVGETVTVTGGTPLLSPESTTVGAVIENKRIVDLPLNGRNFLQLVATAPNVSFGFQSAGQAGSRQGGTRSQQNISVAGQRSYFNRFTIDGVENTDVNFNSPIILPSIDALQEFKVQTGIFPAEFGRASTQINVSTKSGSKEYHGAAFEFLRNDVFDARQYDFTGRRAPDAAKEPFKWNQYGFVLGGPVWIPKLYENKERIFFMTNFEGFRDRRTTRGRYQLPPAAWRTGDFSQLANPIYDPLTRQQFAGNRIPTNRISPTSAKLLEFYPAPTLAPAALGINHEQPNKRFIDKDQFIGRGDFIESAASSWSGRWSWGDEVQLDPGLKLNGTKLLTQVKQGMISNTRTFGGTKVNELRFGYNRFFNSLGRELANTRDVVKELAIPGVASGLPVSWGIPSIAIAGFSGFGDDSEGPYVNTNQTWQIVDNFSLTKGSHSIRFGGELRWDNYNQIGNQFARGAFLFEPNATGLPTATGTLTANTGNSFADFLLGYCKRCEVAVTLAEADFMARSMYFYIDDSWKVTPKLTVNMGLRYEYTPPWLDRSGKLVNIDAPFLDNTPNVSDLSRHPTFVRIGSGDFYQGTSLRFNPAIKVARDGRLGERLVNDDRNDWAPRLGFAYSPTSKWTVRGGAGVFYSQDTGNPRFDMARNLSGRRREESTPTKIDLTWATPFGANAGGNVQINNPYVLGNITTRRTPYILQGMLNVQRDLGNNLLLEIGYLGSVGRKLESLRAFNESIPGTTGSVLSRAPYPEFGRIQQVDGSGKSHYNGLSVKLEKRLSSGVSFVSGYTWSKSIDNASAIRNHNGDTLFPQNSYNLAAEKALSSFHTSHRMVNSVLYQLPFGKSKRWLDRGGITNAVLGGWELGTLFNVQTGFPLTIVSGVDRSNIGAGFDRPDTVAGQVANLDRGERNADRWFNTGAFVLNQPGRFGSTGRNTVISPGIIQWDASLLKMIRFTESKGLQFRFEAFNAANHPNLGNPDTSRNSSNFGRINGTRNNMRELQFGLKLLF
ncbi:MAG: carboxypeptidase-like regulatory domain-containing protein [Blastocatellia bacterium]|nr:carboxypeptidase-like regulatory domain-containing protein [Blastocatellia bacterium]